MNIIITGASSGIGKGLAQYYAKKADRLFLLARREDRLQELKKELECKVDIYTVDVSDFESLQSAINDILSQVDTIDMVIANAGVSLGHNSGFSDFDDFKRLMDINFLSVHALLSPIVPKMQSQKSGKIVLISSLASIVAMPSSIAYSASKRAINSYAEGLRNLVAKDNINVVNIMPGFIASEMTDKNDFKMPFFMSNQEGVRRITKAIDSNKKEYKFPKRFFSLIKVVSMLPISIKDRVIQSIHEKK
jgi:short-subunit dehydrogenase